MKEPVKLKKILPDIITISVVVLLITVSAVLSIYGKSPYMYEGEYVYSGIYGDGSKLIYKLRADYDSENNQIKIKLERIDNYPSSDTDEDLEDLYSDYIGIENYYTSSDDLIVLPDRLDEGVKKNNTDDGSYDNGIMIPLSSYSYVYSSLSTGQYISFGYDGAILSSDRLNYLSVISASSYYLHKNGWLGRLSLEAVRCVLVAAAAFILCGYILIRIRKKRIIASKIVLAICAVLCIGIFACVDMRMDGSYQSIGDEGTSYLTINEMTDGEFFVCSSMPDNTGTHLVFRQKGNRLVNTEDENIYIKQTLSGVKLCDSDTTIAFDSGSEATLNKLISLIMLIPLAVSIISLVYKKRRDGNTEELESLPYGCYTISDIAYINEEMQDMKDYYRSNMLDNEFVLHNDKCILPVRTIEAPEYTLKKKLNNLYPAQGKIKLNRLDFGESDNHGVNYFMAFNKKKFFLVQQLEGITTIVYRLGEKL